MLSSDTRFRGAGRHASINGPASPAADRDAATSQLLIETEKHTNGGALPGSGDGAHRTLCALWWTERDEIGRGDPKCLREPHDVDQRYVAFTAFRTANVGSIKSRLGGKLLQRESSAVWLLFLGTLLPRSCCLRSDSSEAKRPQLGVEPCCGRLRSSAIGAT